MLMCAIAWDGPLPILHTHGAGHTEEWLARHCKVFHSDIAESGFHWHFVRLKDLDGRNPSHQEDDFWQNSECSIATLTVSQRQIAFTWQTVQWRMTAGENLESSQNSGMMSFVACFQPRTDFRDPQSACARLSSWLL